MICLVFRLVVGNKLFSVYRLSIDHLYIYKCHSIVVCLYIQAWGSHPAQMPPGPEGSERLQRKAIRSTLPEGRDSAVLRP